MDCPRCEIPLEYGICLNNSFEYSRDGVAPHKKPISDGKLVKCLKCLKCGYTEVDEINE